MMELDLRCIYFFKKYYRPEGDDARKEEKDL